MTQKHKPILNTEELWKDFLKSLNWVYLLLPTWTWWSPWQWFFLDCCLCISATVQVENCLTFFRSMILHVVHLLTLSCNIHRRSLMIFSSDFCVSCLHFQSPKQLTLVTCDLFFLVCVCAVDCYECKYCNWLKLWKGCCDWEKLQGICRCWLIYLTRSTGDFVNSWRDCNCQSYLLLRIWILTV